MSDLPRETTDLTPSFGPFGDDLEARLIALPHLGEAARPTIRRALQKLQDELLLSEPGLRSATEAQLVILQIPTGIRNLILEWYPAPQVRSDDDDLPGGLGTVLGKLAGAIGELAPAKPLTFLEVIAQINALIKAGQKISEELLGQLAAVSKVDKYPLASDGTISPDLAPALQAMPNYTAVVFLEHTVVSRSYFSRKDKERVGPYSGLQLYQGQDPESGLSWEFGKPVSEDHQILLVWARQQPGFNQNEFDAHEALKQPTLTGYWANQKQRFTAACLNNTQLRAELLAKLFTAPMEATASSASTLPPLADYQEHFRDRSNPQYQTIRDILITLFGDRIRKHVSPVFDARVDGGNVMEALRTLDIEVRKASSNLYDTPGAYLTIFCVADLQVSYIQRREALRMYIEEVKKRLPGSRPADTWRDPYLTSSYEDVVAIIKFLEARLVDLS